jgi:cytochrome P450
MTPPDPFFELLASDGPSPGLHRLRAAAPVHRVEPLGFWLVTRHDDVRELFNDSARVSPDKRLWSAYVAPPEGTLMRWADDNGLFALSREGHARLRRLVTAAFTPRAVRRMDAQIREVVERVAAPLRERRGQVVDLLAEFTQIVPNAVISRLTGVPPGDDEARFRRLAQSVIPTFVPFTPPALRERAEADFQALAAWVRELVAKRRAHPEEDLVTDLVHAQSEDERLSDDDVVLLLSGIVAAGSETIALSGARIIKLLLAPGAPTPRLRADPALIQRSIDEIIRFALDSPGGPMRYALCDFELRGRAIRRGDMLMLSLGGANRDPEVYTEPDRLDLEREVRNLAAFGAGPHFCLGANLARQELACMTELLLEVLPPGSRVREDRLELQDVGLFLRTLNLPVEIAR